MLRTIAAAAALMLVCLPVAADECAEEIEKIDQALAAATETDEEQKNQARDLRDAAEKMHRKGDHERALRRLQMAKRILKFD